MKKLSIKTFALFYRADNKRAADWSIKIGNWFKKRHPLIKFTGSKKPDLLVVLGGDGTILEAARKYQKYSPLILGLNLGHVGFSASVREPKKFLPSLEKLIKGKYFIAKRMMISADVLRKNKLVFSTTFLNEAAVQNPLGMVDVEVSVAGHPIQYVHGTGIIISTASGSTAYNLSAHGPIVMPDIKCMIITELMDHNIPTPSIVVKRNREIILKISNFRKKGLLSITKNNEKVDVLMISDGETIFPLAKNDIVVARRSPRLIKFAELEKNYFFKSLQEKFAFK